MELVVEYDNFQNTGTDFESSAYMFDIIPTVAYKINDFISVGIGLNIYYGGVTSENTLTPYPAAPNTYIHQKHEWDGISGFGGNIGVLMKPTKELGIGIRVKTMTKMKVEGTSTTEVVTAGRDCTKF